MAIDRCEGGATGILETAATTFLLLIATRWFHAGATAKAIIASGGSLGLLLSPLVVTWAEASRLPVARAASLVLAAGAVSFAVMTLFPVLPIFVAFGLIAMACSSAAIPLMTQVYQMNYPPEERGRLFSKAMVVRIGMAALANELGGRLLAVHLDYFRALLLFFAAAFAFGAWCQYVSYRTTSPTPG
mgnify:CR=1 FL=1